MFENFIISIFRFLCHHFYSLSLSLSLSLWQTVCCFFPSCQFLCFFNPKIEKKSVFCVEPGNDDKRKGRKTSKTYFCDMQETGSSANVATCIKKLTDFNNSISWPSFLLANLLTSSSSIIIAIINNTCFVLFFPVRSFLFIYFFFLSSLLSFFLSFFTLF